MPKLKAPPPLILMAEEAAVFETRKPEDKASIVPDERTRLTSSSILARNATLNLVTEGWTFVVMAVAMPKLVAFLGETPFGLFSLAWVVIGYLAFLDVGVNRAATKFLSQHLAERDHASALSIVRTAILANLTLGLAGGLAVVFASSPFIHSVFKVSPELQSQARLTFLAVGLAVPVLLAQGVLRAVLTSFQKFNWINGVNALAVTVQWITAALLAWRGYGVALVVFSTVMARILATVAYGIVVFRLFPDIFPLGGRRLHGLPKLLRFGTWVTISQLVSPALVYLDRLLIASFLSLSAVTLYTVPYEAMTRLRVIPSSLATTLYPAFSERGMGGHEAKLQGLYEGSLRYLLILVLPGTLFLLVFGSDLLSLWMGNQFAVKTAAILQILAVGALTNAVAYIPYNALQALGRPDLTGKFHVLELPVHLLLCIILIPKLGIVGAALASTVRFGLDAVLLFWAARHYCKCSLQGVWKRITGIVTLSILLGSSMLGAHLLFSVRWVRLGTGLLAVAIYFLACWRFVLSERERPAIVRALGLFRLRISH